MDNISVIGSGTMGIGIAQLAATHAHNVVVYDNNFQACEAGKIKLEKIFNRLVEKQRVSQAEADSIQNRIQYTDNLTELSESNLVIEAIVENKDIKSQLFKSIEEIVSEQCVIATNTSSLSVTELASSLDMPNRFMGIHFFNPAPLMKLVELIPVIQTDNEVTNAVYNLISSWKKEAVVVKDSPGFIVNKVARPFYGESLRILDEGLSTIETIDWALTELAGFRMGPFTLMDYIGNDVNYAVTKSVFEAFYHDGRYRPSFTQRNLAAAGYLGRKSGKGYYDYSQELPEPIKDEKLGKKIVDRVVVMLINEAADTLDRGIASMQDIETAMTKGVNYPKGLFAWADQLGIQYCVNEMDKLFNRYHEERYRCSPLLRDMAKNNEEFHS